MVEAGQSGGSIAREVDTGFCASSSRSTAAIPQVEAYDASRAAPLGWESVGRDNHVHNARGRAGSPGDTRNRMHRVRVQKKELSDRVAANRDRHREQFSKGLELYKAAVIAELEVWMERARKGKRVRARTALVAPEDHTQEYDQLLDMLAMSVEDEIELTAQEFAQYVRDDWGWKRQFTNTMLNNSRYLERRRQ